MEKELVIRGDKELALYELDTRFAVAVRQRELLENYIRERLHPDKHFYTVGDEPGRKPSLTKEGAELICLPHNLKGHYEWLSGPENPPMDNTPYQITMKCIFENNGRFEGEGVGSASSYITKKDGEFKPRQKDPGLCHNATVKMACKSAYIAATLNSTAASEFFTQDLEDDQTGEFKGKAQANKKEHWCEKHHVKFFKTERMKAWAHSIKNEDGSPTLDDNGKQIWCSEKTVQPQAKTAVAEPEERPEQPPQPSGQVLHPKEGKSIDNPLQEAWEGLAAKLNAARDNGMIDGSNVVSKLKELGSKVMNNKPKEMYASLSEDGKVAFKEWVEEL